MNRSLPLALLVLPFALFAESATPDRNHPPTSPGGQPREARKDGHGDGAGMSLGRLLEMDDAKLARMRGLIEKVEKMPAAERADLRKRMHALRDATPEAREAFAKELREKFGAPDASRCAKPAERPGKSGEAQGKAAGARSGPIRDLLEKHFASLPPDQAKAEKEKFLTLSREEKMAYLKALRTQHGLPEVPEAAPAAPESTKDKSRKPHAAHTGPRDDRDDLFRPAA